KPVYVQTKEDRAFADNLWVTRGFTGKTVVGVGVAANDPKRSLSIEHSRQICKEIEARGWLPVVVDATFNFPEYPAINGLRMPNLISAIAKMDVVVTVDTGLLHMAGA